MTKSDFEAILKDVAFRNYRFIIREDRLGTVLYLQAEYDEQCALTGNMTIQKTRKWRLSEHMTKSEFVQTVFACVMQSVEHTVREFFKYRGRAVYSPHYDVDALWAMRQMDVREE
jgi:hypothetical protein